MKSDIIDRNVSKNSTPPYLKGQNECPDYLKDCAISAALQAVAPRGNQDKVEDTKKKKDNTQITVLNYLKELKPSFDIIKKCIFIKNQKMDNESISGLRLSILEKFGWHPPKEWLFANLVALSNKAKFNSVENYFKSLPVSNTNHLDNCLQELFNNEVNELDKILFRKWMIQSVRRAMEPGSDAAGVLIFKGAQGVGKSRFFKEMCFDKDLFTDAKVDIKNDQKVGIIYGSKWIVEFAEIESITGIKANTVKQFITKTHDNFEVKFEMMADQIPRCYSLAGTTNDDIICRDQTGNRRYWIIEVSRGACAEKGISTQYRDELWSEAYQAYLAGESSRLSLSEEMMINERNSGYMLESPMVDYINRLMENQPLIDKLSTADLKEICGKDYDRFNAKNIMSSLGWELKAIRVGDKVTKGYQKTGEK